MMKDIELMSIEDCKGKECYFCGSDDVQFLAITEDREERGYLVEVFCCKKCVEKEKIKNENDKRF